MGAYQKEYSRTELFNQVRTALRDDSSPVTHGDGPSPIIAVTASLSRPDTRPALLQLLATNCVFYACFVMHDLILNPD